MEIIQSDTPAAIAGAKLNEALQRHARVPILLLLSGGSALSILKYVDVGVCGEHITITTLDERFSPDPAIRNFAQIQATDFYQEATKRGVKTIGTTVAFGESLSEAGRQFEAALRQWREAHPEGVMLTTMGVGADGHTAGIFPGEYGVDFSGDAWAVAYQVPESVNPYTQRITVSYTFLKEQIHESLFFITGIEKQPVVSKITAGICSIEYMPACVATQLQNVVLVTNLSV